MNDEFPADKFYTNSVGFLDVPVSLDTARIDAILRSLVEGEGKRRVNDTDRERHQFDKRTRDITAPKHRHLYCHSLHSAANHVQAMRRSNDRCLVENIVWRGQDGPWMLTAARLKLRAFLLGRLPFRT